MVVGKVGKRGVGEVENRSVEGWKEQREGCVEWKRGV